MVRDPSDRLALPHWCVHWGGVITNTVQDRGARCRSSAVPPLSLSSAAVAVTNRATRGARSAGSGVGRAVLTSSMGELQFSWPAPPRVLPFTPRFVWILTTAGMEADWRVLALTQANIMNSQKRSLSVSTKKACQVEVARSRVCVHLFALFAFL